MLHLPYGSIQNIFECWIEHNPSIFRLLAAPALLEILLPDFSGKWWKVQDVAGKKQYEADSTYLLRKGKQIAQLNIIYGFKLDARAATVVAWKGETFAFSRVPALKSRYCSIFCKNLLKKSWWKSICIKAKKSSIFGWMTADFTVDDPLNNLD